MVYIFIAFCLIVVIGFIFFIANSTNKSEYVGVVGDTKISKADYQKNLDQTKAFYAYSKQDLSKLTSLDKDTLQITINNSIVQNYAEKYKITVTEAEIQNRYMQVVAGFNRNNKITVADDEAFLSKINQMYGIDKNTYLDQLRIDILKEKVQAAVKMPLAKWLAIQNK